MRSIVLFFCCVLDLAALANPVTDQPAPKYSGIYIGKTKEIKAGNQVIEMFTYLRFYADSTVCVQTVNSVDPQAAAKWFGRFKKFSQIGKYFVQNGQINIHTSNAATEDAKLEGVSENNYKGSIQNSGKKLCLDGFNDNALNCFEFYPVSDTSYFKYSTGWSNVKIPGEWMFSQVLKGSRQFFVRNADSTDVAFAFHTAASFPDYNKDSSNFSNAFVFYTWDADYMRDDEKMQVRKIEENREEAYIIWNAKDKYNDNYFLFACDKGTYFNLMLSGTAIKEEEKINFLKTLYRLNRQ